MLTRYYILQTTSSHAHVMLHGETHIISFERSSTVSLIHDVKSIMCRLQYVNECDGVMLLLCFPRLPCSDVMITLLATRASDIREKMGDFWIRIRLDALLEKWTILYTRTRRDEAAALICLLIGRYIVWRNMERFCLGRLSGCANMQG